MLWHYYWKTKGGTHIGNRGVGMWGNYLYVETPDNYLISLDARTGKERWHVPIASFEEQYFSTTAPIVVGDHVLVGTGNDLDMPGFLQSFDPETGKLQWKFYTVPMNPGDPGLETWKDLDAARHGGGNPWVPGSYDPETKLYIIGTGNPSPAYFPEKRGNKDALFTCSLVAIDVETGKMRWYYQTSPNDTHDWDSAQTPVLADLPIDGKMRKVAMTAARNGYFFVVDRVTGEHLVTSKFSESANWAYPELNAKGQPVRRPEKDHAVGGALVSMANGGAANWQPPSYSPDYGLFYVPVAESWAMYYTAETDPRGGVGLGGKEEIPTGGKRLLKAIDPKTGKIAWQHEYPVLPNLGMVRSGGNGLLTTAGRLLFADDPAGNLVARDPANGKPLWHYALGTVSNAPETYMLDGKQYVLVASGDTLNVFTLE
jgi:alcohol dehydrogenase (cytochrome c)